MSHSYACDEYCISLWSCNTQRSGHVEFIEVLLCMCDMAHPYVCDESFVGTWFFDTQYSHQVEFIEFLLCMCGRDDSFLHVRKVFHKYMIFLTHITVK